MVLQLQMIEFKQSYNIFFAANENKTGFIVIPAGGTLLLMLALVAIPKSGLRKLTN